MVTEVAAPSLPTNDKYPAPKDVDVGKTSQDFLKQLEDAAGGDGNKFASLFIQDGYWRDVLAFTRDFRTIDSANLAEVASVRHAYPILSDPSLRSRRTRRTSSSSRRRRRPRSRAPSRT